MSGGDSGSVFFNVRIQRIEKAVGRDRWMKDIRNDFFDDIYKLLEDARKNVKKAVNLAMVYSYFEVGWKIVEEEQNGEDRAQYGQYIVKELSEYLT